MEKGFPRTPFQKLLKREMLLRITDSDAVRENIAQATYESPEQWIKYRYNFISVANNSSPLSKVLDVKGAFCKKPPCAIHTTCDTI